MKKIAVTLFLCVTGVASTFAQTVNANTIVFADPTLGGNGDPTAIYRSDLSTDFTRLRVQLGDEETGLFEMGYPYYSTGQWTNIFTVDGYGNGYFRGHVGIGTAAPASWFGGRVLEIADTRPVLKLSSSTTLSTLLFTNANINSTTHNGEFHVNHTLNVAAHDQSKLSFYSYPGGSNFEIRADGHVAIQDNKQFRLRSLATSETAIGFDGATETVRISNTKDNYDRFIALGGYTGATWAQQLTLNTKNGNVGIGTTSPTAKLHVVGGEINIDADQPIRGGGRWLISGNATQVTVGTANPGIHLKFDAGASNRMFINGSSGNVGIGTISPDQMLTVKGKIHAEEVIIDLAVPAPDYVFEKTYDLKSLDDVKTYIDQHKHLPEVPSAKEMETNGVKVGEMEVILLKKIEELTLHMINTNEQVKSLLEQNTVQKSEILKLSQEVKSLRSNK